MILSLSHFPSFGIHANARIAFLRCLMIQQVNPNGEVVLLVHCLLILPQQSLTQKDLHHNWFDNICFGLIKYVHLMTNLGILRLLEIRLAHRFHQRLKYLLMKGVALLEEAQILHRLDLREAPDQENYHQVVLEPYECFHCLYLYCFIGRLFKR